MFDRVSLLDEHLELLTAVVEASRRQPRGDKRPFLLLMTQGGDQIIHSSLPGGNLTSNEEDVEILARYGLVSAKRTQRYTLSFYVTPEGFEFYERVKTSDRTPAEQVEADIRQLIDSEGFRTRYPEAHRKWVAAESLLWRDREGDLSTIGHLCREAMQEFAAALVERFKPAEALPRKDEDVGRIRAVLSQRKRYLSATRVPLLDALLVYWGTTTDMVQRQEHSAAKEREPVTWEDARTVVLQTLIVFTELDRSLA